MVILLVMKTAVSLPDDVFRRADAYATRLGMARSRLYAQALVEFLDAHADDHVTEALNEVYAHETSDLNADLVAAQAAAVSDEDW